MPENENELIEPREETGAEQEEQPTPAKSFSFTKVGIPVLLIQVILAYYLASQVILPRLYGKNKNASKSEKEAVVDREGGEDSEESEEAPKFGKIFSLEDVIVNPAESKGMQFVLINFGFEVKEDSDLEILKKREVQVRDILIKILSSKTLDQLDGPNDKEILRQEVKEAVKHLLPPKHLMNVYFANYIIQ